MKTIYISGQITGNPDFESDFKQAEYKIKKYRGGLIEIINPIRVRPFLGIKKWLFYMIPAVFNVLNSDEVYLISNWHQSKGAKIEFRIASYLGKPVYLINDYPDFDGYILFKNGYYHCFEQQFYPRGRVLRKVVPMFELMGN